MTTRAARRNAEPETLAWFVAHCEGRTEADVVTALDEADIEAWCPSETRWKCSPRRKEPIRVALLPGYVFVGLGVTRPFHAVLGIEGVIGFLGMGAPREIAYGAPTPEFMLADAPHPFPVVPRSQAWREPRTLWELRAMEAAGVFDYTRNSDAAKAAKRAKVTLRGFAGLAGAIAEKTAP